MLSAIRRCGFKPFSDTEVRVLSIHGYRSAGAILPWIRKCGYYPFSDTEVRVLSLSDVEVLVQSFQGYGSAGTILPWIRKCGFKTFRDTELRGQSFTASICFGFQQDTLCAFLQSTELNNDYQAGVLS